MLESESTTRSLRLTRRSDVQTERYTGAAKLGVTGQEGIVRMNFGRA